MVRNVLRLHRNTDGILWAGTDSRMASDSGLPAIQAFTELPMESISEIQLFGSVTNAPLVEQLYFVRQRGGLPDGLSIRLGSPAGCPASIGCEESLRALWTRDMVEGPGFRWVDLAQREYTSYALIAALIRNNWKVNDSCRKIVKYHPAWPALSFIPSINLDAACMLLAVIVDPRWFVQDFRPNRVNKLYQFLGIMPRNMQFIDGQDVMPLVNYERCSIVLRSWANSIDGLKEGAPEAFLQRICRHEGSWSRGMLLASKAFIRFVREVWMSELSPHRKMFDPDMFFKSKAEADAFKLHYKQARKRTARDTCA